MLWERPDFTEIRMDAEINGYQGDDAPDPIVPWCNLQPSDRSAGQVNDKQYPPHQKM